MSASVCVCVYVLWVSVCVCACSLICFSTDAIVRIVRKLHISFSFSISVSSLYLELFDSRLILDPIFLQFTRLVKIDRNSLKIQSVNFVLARLCLAVYVCVVCVCVCVFLFVCVVLLLLFSHVFIL